MLWKILSVSCVLNKLQIHIKRKLYKVYIIFQPMRDYWWEMISSVIGNRVPIAIEAWAYIQQIDSSESSGVFRRHRKHADYT